MNMRDDYCHPEEDYLRLAQQVEIIQKAGRCEESTAALVVLANQFRDIAYHLKRLSCTVAEWEAEWEGLNI